VNMMKLERNRIAALFILFVPVAATAASVSTEVETLSCEMTSQRDQETVYFTLELDEERAAVVHVLENGTTHHVDGLYGGNNLLWKWTAEILPGASISNHYELDRSTLSLRSTLTAEMDEDDREEATATEYLGRCLAR